MDFFFGGTPAGSVHHRVGRMVQIAEGWVKYMSGGLCPRGKAMPAAEGRDGSMVALERRREWYRSGTSGGFLT